MSRSRPARTRVAVAVASTALVVACSSAAGAGDATARYCQVTADTHPELADILATDTASMAVPEVSALTERVQRIFEKRRDAAPPDLEPSWRTVMSYLDSGGQAQPGTYFSTVATRATTTINRYTTDVCHQQPDVGVVS